MTSRTYQRRGQQILIVSSGAIAVGRRRLGLTNKDRALRLEEKQAAAAAGQIRLAHAYEQALARHGITVAQILVTPDDTEERRRHLNARNTLMQLLILRRHPGHQRERYRGHRRDPLRRQRPARRARRGHGQRRYPGPAVRYRRAIRARSTPGPRRRDGSPRSPPSRPRSRRWPAPRRWAIRRAAW